MSIVLVERLQQVPSRDLSMFQRITTISANLAGIEFRRERSSCSRKAHVQPREDFSIGRCPSSSLKSRFTSFLFSNNLSFAKRLQSMLFLLPKARFKAFQIPRQKFPLSQSFLLTCENNGSSRDRGRSDVAGELAS